MKKKRTYNTKHIKQGCSYTIEDITELLEVHPNTVHNWIDAGLPCMTGKTPHLIYGAELIDFLNTKQRKRKHPCKAEEFYCCKCRVPRPAWEGVADITIRNKNQLTITGICAVCEGKIVRGGATIKLPEYQKIFAIQTIRNQHLIERG